MQLKTKTREFVKRNFPSLYWNNLIKKRLIGNKESFLHESGWYKSLTLGKPYTSKSEEIPWLNYGFFNFISERLLEDFILFEYGSGASTQYFSKKVKRVISVEHDENWYNKVKNEVPENTTLVFEQLETGGAYSKLIQRFDEEFDVVLVDGRDRINCVKQSVSKLSARGVIILDNSNRERYQGVFSWMEQQAFKQITFTGILPGGFKLDATTIFYRQENCLGI